MNRPINRIQPVGPPAAYKTYEVSSPLDTHTREATCAEVDCETQKTGWLTVVDEATELGQRQAHYIRTMSGRDYMESRGPDGTRFRFPPGEECFTPHRVSLERPEFYVVRGGDWRGNPTRDVYVHDRPEHWVEDFAEHQDRLDRTING